MSRAARAPTVMIAGAALAATLASGCATVENERLPDPIAKLDETAFACTAEPVLVRQCSYSACHGQPDAALRVYSVGKLRAKPPTNADEAALPLTAAEHHANYQSAAAFAIGVADPIDNWLLRKPLPASLGGYEHIGGAIFHTTADPEFAAVLTWLKGAKQCK